MSRGQKWLGSFFDKTTGPHTRLRAELFTGVDNRLCRYCQGKADYRPYVFAQIKTWGCISGKTFFSIDDLFLSGHNNPRVHFRFRITVVGK